MLVAEHGEILRDVDLNVTVDGVERNLVNPTTLASYEVNSFMSRFMPTVGCRQVGKAKRLNFHVHTFNGKVVIAKSDITIITVEGYKITVRMSRHEYVIERNQKRIVKANEEKWRPAKLFWDGMLRLL